MPPESTVSDEDSGDDDEGGDMNNLSGGQLSANAELSVTRYGEKCTVWIESKEENDSSDFEPGHSSEVSSSSDSEV